MDHGVAEVDHPAQILGQFGRDDALLVQQIKAFGAGGGNAHLVILDDVVGQVSGLITCTQHVEIGRILPGEVGRKAVRVGPVLFASAKDTALNVLNFVGDDVVHTAAIPAKGWSPERRHF